MCVWIVELAQEEGHIVLPRYPSEGTEIGYSYQVTISVLLVAYLKLSEVRLVVHVPAEDDRAEAKAFLCNGEELLLSHELPAHYAIHIHSANLDCIVVPQDLGQRLDRDFGVTVRHGEGNRARCQKGRMRGEVNGAYNTVFGVVEARGSRMARRRRGEIPQEEEQR